MSRFAYAFKRLGETNPHESIIYLTTREFDFFFDYEAPKVVWKALAYSVFNHSVAGMLQRIPLDEPDTTETPLNG